MPWREEGRTGGQDKDIGRPQGIKGQPQQQGAVRSAGKGDRYPPGLHQDAADSLFLFAKRQDRNLPEPYLLMSTE